MHSSECCHYVHVIGSDIALLTMSLVELGTAISFEHENDHILSKYLSHLVAQFHGMGLTQVPLYTLLWVALCVVVLS